MERPGGGSDFNLLRASQLYVDVILRPVMGSQRPWVGMSDKAKSPPISDRSY
ncbi:MAG: hypothetical protein JRN37_03015 [Nitrososphaerota archaeon]|jgi:hypothetical protein|nr:hypothetical protein [Nitrososphaerota archaeon]